MKGNMENLKTKTFQLDELHKLVDGKVVCVTCEYDPGTPATKTCYYCGVGLCKSCGYYADDKVMCNNCYRDYEGRCPKCDNELEPIYENNGADEMGARHDEISGYKPCDCERGDL